ncbi:hypothetical protein AYO38_11440 [bacterium SCGC AG-212-C10]|nr:hypothetical protein AYO38_11440 [bacterium SCGC AG-212-C10]
MDPQVEGLLQMMAAAGGNAPRMYEMDAATARAGADAGFAMFNTGAPALASDTVRTIPGPAGEIRVRVQTPNGDGPFPLLVYIHGGGYVIGTPETHQKLTAELASGAGVVVVSVDYRLAPENKPPAMQDDCVAAIRWAVANAADLNADGTRFAVAGDSAGANLTAASCLRLRDEGGPQPRLQLLIYGAFDFDMEKPSYKANGEGYILDIKSIQWFMDNYIGGLEGDLPYLAPLKHDLAGVAPAFLQVGTLDPLLDDSLLYHAKLKAAGVNSRLQVYEDMPHVFIQLSAFLTTAKRAVDDSCAALKAALA